ncbi:MAG: hypothetical protein JSV49_06385 [Thermoplasmata archaeon]|nr:MAG: hypothetical protein JSV49_06385 [Thermoplasmata archaeon]
MANIEPTESALPDIQDAELPLKHFEVIPCVSIRKGRLVKIEGNKIKPLKFRGIVPNTLDTMDILFETFETILVMDQDGIIKNKPAIDLYRKISQLGDFWVDGGARVADGVIDLLVGGAQYAVLSTKSLCDLNELREAFSLSENIIFGLEFNNGILSPDLTLRNRPPFDVIREVREIGLETCVFADIGRVVKNSNLDRESIRSLLKTRMRLYISGGIKCSDLSTLNSLGVNGAIVDIEEILNNPQVFSIDKGLLDEIVP